MIKICIAVLNIWYFDTNAGFWSDNIMWSYKEKSLKRLKFKNEKLCLEKFDNLLIVFYYFIQ